MSLPLIHTISTRTTCDLPILDPFNSQTHRVSYHCRPSYLCLSFVVVVVVVYHLWKKKKSILCLKCTSWSCNILAEKFFFVFVCVCVSTRCRREEKARKVTWYLLYVCKYVCCKYVKSWLSFQRSLVMFRWHPYRVLQSNCRHLFNVSHSRLKNL